MGLHAFRPVLAIALLIGAAHARAQVDEATLKAAFVYNFALYTSWPVSPGEPHELTLCIAKTSSLAPALRALEGKPVQSRELVLRELETGSASKGLLREPPRRKSISFPAFLGGCAGDWCFCRTTM